MPMIEAKSSVNPLIALPGQVLSWAAPPGEAVTLSCKPSQPPTRCRPTRVSGSSAATMTKNCSTSL